LVLVIPLLVSARAASHGVQMVERYFEELEATGDKRHAVSIAMGELLLPGGIGVLADAAGILTFQDFPLQWGYTDEPAFHAEAKRQAVNTWIRESGAFDAVIANHMLYHVPDRARALTEIRRVLRPGGRLVIGDLGKWSCWAARRRLRAFDHRFRRDPPGRQSAQDEARHRHGRLDRFRHEARRAAGAFQPRKTRRRSAERLDATAPFARHGPTRRSLA
jgi:SAM-dependent methyltransferase